MWVNHTVRCCGTGSPMGQQWAQIRVTGGNDRHDAGAAADLSGRERRPAPLDGLGRRRQARRHGARLQRRELDDEPGHPLRGTARRRSGRHAAADRDVDAARRHARHAARQLRRQHVHPLGRLQRDGARPERLRLLVHDRVLRDDGHELADAHRLVPAQPELRSRRRRRRHAEPDDHVRRAAPTGRTATPDFTVSATASSGLPVSFSATDNCTVSGNVVHLTGAGSCTITASQAGDATYAPAPDVSQTLRDREGIADDLVRGARRTRRTAIRTSRSARRRRRACRCRSRPRATAPCRARPCTSRRRARARSRRRRPATRTTTRRPTSRGRSRSTRRLAGTPLTITSSVEGTLSFSSGAWVNGGWHVKLSTANASPVTVTLTGNVNLPVTCPSGGGSGGTITVPVSKTVTIPAGSTSYVPTNDRRACSAGWARCRLRRCAARTRCATRARRSTRPCSRRRTRDSSRFQFHYRVPVASQEAEHELHRFGRHGLPGEVELDGTHLAIA